MKTAAEYGDTLLAVDSAAEGCIIGQIVHRQYVPRTVTGQAVRERVGAKRKHQSTVFKFAVFSADALTLCVDRGDPGVRQHRRILVRRHFFRAGAGERRSRTAGSQGVRQVGLGVEGAVVCRHERDRRGGVALADFLQQGVAGEAGTDDDD
jgi:hypothetical protein